MLQAKQAYLRELNHAVSSYESVSSQVAEGTNFYASAVERLDALQAKVTSYIEQAAEHTRENIYMGARAAL